MIKIIIILAVIVMIWLLSYRIVLKNSSSDERKIFNIFMFIAAIMAVYKSTEKGSASDLYDYMDILSRYISNFLF